MVTASKLKEPENKAPLNSLFLVSFNLQDFHIISHWRSIDMQNM